MARKTTVQVLKEARALLARRGGWCKHELVRVGGPDSSGTFDDSVANPYAYQFCAIGAIMRAGYGRTQWSGPLVRAPLGALQSLLPDKWAGLGIACWNNAQRTKRPVLALFDRAIAAEEAKVTKRFARNQERAQ